MKGIAAKDISLVQKNPHLIEGRETNLGMEFDCFPPLVCDCTGRSVCCA